jgi:DtxR family Mn-dependent transcriptional regulator
MPQDTVRHSELSASVQDYAKAIFTLETTRGGATTTALAERLNVRPGSVSGMLRKLSALELVEHERYRGVRLTGRGRAVALEVIRHHRLLELFLVESLDMSWDEVHAEAERLEHVLSDQLEEAIAAKLGDPILDPHGETIPTRELEMTVIDSRSLYELAPGEAGTLVEISDPDSEMLSFLASQQIALGAELEVIDRQPFEGPVFVRLGDRVQVLGAVVARAMRVAASPLEEPGRPR